MLRFAPLVACAAVLAAPAVLGPYYTTLLLPALGYGVALLGMNVLFGYAGLLSFGHALYFAIGAYAAACMTSILGVLHIEAVFAAAVIAALLVAVPIGLLCVRYVRIFFGILTLAFSMLFYSFLFKFYHLTGGDEGIRVLRPLLFGQEFGDLDKTTYLTGPFYYYLVGLLVVATLIMHRVVSSPFGLCLRAVRDNPQKAEYLGVRVRQYRFAAFLLSAAYCAIAGVVVSVPAGLAEPGQAYWLQSGELIFMLLLGGYTNFYGPAVGAFSFIFLHDQVMSVTDHWRIVFGALLAIIVIFVPRGLMGLLDPRGRWST